MFKNPQKAMLVVLIVLVVAGLGYLIFFQKPKTTAVEVKTAATPAETTTTV